MHSRDTNFINRQKNQPHNVHGRHQTYAKNGNDMETLICHRKMGHANDEKRKMTLV